MNTHPKTREAVVLLSGGMDSATTLAIATAEDYRCSALTFDYGQRHRAEIAAARRIAQSAGVMRHQIVALNLSGLAASALTTADATVPTNRTPEEILSGIPSTYVPARNTVFLAIALAWMETLGATDIFIGVNATDHPGYPDCREAFIRAFEKLSNLATKSGVEGRRIRIQAPLLDLTKPQIIKRGAELGVDFSMTHSCFRPTPDGLACGMCDPCILRRAGFAEAGIPDPTRYADSDT